MELNIQHAYDYASTNTEVHNQGHHNDSLQKRSQSPTEKATRIVDVGKCQRVRRKSWRVLTDFKIFEGLAFRQKPSDSVGFRRYFLWILRR